MPDHDDDGSVFTDEGYLHWPANHPLLGQPFPPAHYATRNVQHSRRYVPGTTRSAPAAPSIVDFDRYQPGLSYPPVMPQPMDYGQGYDPNYHGAPATQYAPPGWYAQGPYQVPQQQHVYHSAAPAQQQVAYQGMPVNNTCAQPAIFPSHNPGWIKPAPWFGRTSAEVQEDNMKIAAQENVYEKRSIAPRDMADDQRFWVIEVDGSQTIREYREVKGMKGEWKEDPRFEGSMYFVRAADTPSKK